MFLESFLIYPVVLIWANFTAPPTPDPGEYLAMSGDDFGHLDWEGAANISWVEARDVQCVGQFFLNTELSSYRHLRTEKP